MPISDPGYVSDVSAGGAVDPAWGNAMRNRTVQHFANATDRDANIVSPTEGMCCYLNDVDKFLVYNGVAWRAPWNLPWGIGGGGQATSTADQGPFTAIVDIAGVSVTWTAVANRSYRITVISTHQIATNNSTSAYTIADNAGTAKEVYNFRNTSSGGTESVSFSYYELGIGAGTQTRKLRANSATNMTIKGTSNPIQITVSDEGPNGAAA